MKFRRRLLATLLFMVISASAYPVFSATVYLYVDAAPNIYGSSEYDSWKSTTYSSIIGNTFINMSSGVNASNIGTTNFEIQDEVVYSFGDLGKRLTWIYWVPNTTIADLTNQGFSISLYNYWDGDELDFYKYYYGSTWITPSSWAAYEGGVIGTAGMAWWGAKGVNTQEALDLDMAAWSLANERWIFTVKSGEETYSLTSNREAVTPEPGTMLLMGIGAAGIAFVKRRKAKAVM